MDKKNNTTTYDVPLVLNCWSYEHDNADCDVALVDLSKTLLVTAGERQALFDEINRRRTDVLCVQYEDWSAKFYAGRGMELERALESEEFKTQNWTVLPSSISLADDDCQCLDWCWVEYNTYGFRWQAVPRKTGITISTIELSKPDLLKHGPVAE